MYNDLLESAIKYLKEHSTKKPSLIQLLTMLGDR